MDVLNSLRSPNLTVSQSQLQPEYQYSVSNEGPSYKDYKLMGRELIPLSRASIYLLMAVLVVVAAAYAIVGHLIKDLAHDIVDCILGPHMESKNHSAHHDLRSTRPLLPLPVDKMNVYCLPSQPEVCLSMPQSCDNYRLPDSYCSQRKASLQSV